MARLSALPIDSRLEEILRVLDQGPNLVLQAAPGAGKTTRVPPALLSASWRGDGEILVLEPRRLAAKMAARRVADEIGARLGGLVGYQFRFENAVSSQTRVRFLTEGMLMRRFLSDPLLKGVACVVVDEFHERHLHGDLALALLRRLQLGDRPELRIVVMSATLDAESVAGYLGDAPVISVEGRAYEVRVTYPARASDLPLEAQVREAVRESLDSAQPSAPGDAGHVLVFLPGMAEIRRCAAFIEGEVSSRGGRVFALHGELPREEQDAAVGPSSGIKVILATNVAETSLTIPGVTTVVDSGLARQASYSWWSGLPSLRTRSISRASAIQRAGRAGRTAPGRCFRLYTKHDFDTRQPYESPEIQRADLSQCLLELASIGVPKLSLFPWFEVPKEASVEGARSLLHKLGALTSASGALELTPIGKEMARLPVHPRLARLALEAVSLGVSDAGSWLAALLSEGGIDGVDVVEIASRARSGGVYGSARKVRDRLVQSLPRISGAKPAVDEEEALCRAILRGFPDRVAKLRQDPKNERHELVLSSGGSARFEDARHFVGSEYFVAVDAEERVAAFRGGRGMVTASAVCAIRPEWLFDLEPEGVSENEERIWDPQRGRVEIRTRITYGQLVLDESRSRPSDPVAATRFLLESALGPKGPGPAAFIDSGQLESLCRRIAFLKNHGAGAELPDLSNQEQLIATLSRHCEGAMSLDELREMRVISLLLESLPSQARAELDRSAPEAVSLPSRRRVEVNYEQDKPPWIQSRLQDFFGLKDGPSVLGGRVPLTLHILAPNKRAVQITTDLSGFWKNHYPSVRKELSRRYPRHKWPEDPLKPYSGE